MRICGEAIRKTAQTFIRGRNRRDRQNLKKLCKSHDEQHLKKSGEEYFAGYIEKLERFNEKTGFIETEEREQIYDYLSSCFKDKWYDELEEIFSEADF